MRRYGRSVGASMSVMDRIILIIAFVVVSLHVAKDAKEHSEARYENRRKK
jgi:uncharacterized membrane-anchored protein YitT (DUF2179 family)